MESGDEEGQGEGGAAGGDVGGTGGLRLVTQVVGTVTVGLRLEHRNINISSYMLTIFRRNQGGISYKGSKTRPESQVDAIVNAI